MAKSKKPAKISSSSDDKQDKAPEKLNLCDQNALRHKLDETVSQVVTQSGYKENSTVTYVKIVLGLVSVGAALYAQFGPGTFPNNWWTVFGCVVGYVVLTIALNVYCFLFEKDAFLICHPRKEYGEDTPLYAMSHMERYSDTYQLQFCSSLTPSSRSEVQLQKSVTSYFHSDGYLAEEVFTNDILQLLEKYQASSKAKSSKKQQ